MRSTANLSITLPPDMLESIEKLAKAENRTMSELVREALRGYQQENRETLIQKYRVKAEARGVTEPDVVPIIQEHRAQERAQKGRQPSR